MAQGFYLTLKFKKKLSEKEYDEITDSFIENVVEECNLLFGGGGFMERYSGYITSKNKNEKIRVERFLRILKNWISENNKIVIGYIINEQ